jgi:hypothetical protein
VAPAEPGRDRPRQVGVMTPRQRRAVQTVEFSQRGENPFRVQSGELSRLRGRRIGPDRAAGSADTIPVSDAASEVPSSETSYLSPNPACRNGHG